MSVADRVTVVTPVYNGARFIRASVESALAQRPYVDEVFVVDDGSTDDSIAIVASFGDRVSVVALDHTGNPSVARNAGVERSSNDLIAFLDADDIWLPDKIAAQTAVLDARPEVGVVCTNAYRQTFEGQDEGMTPLLRAEFGTSGDVLDDLIVENFVITSSVLARKQSLLDAGMFSASEHLPAVEDYDLWLRVAHEVGFAYLSEPWLIYRDWGASYRGEWSAIQTAEGLLRVLERLDERYPGSGVARASAYAPLALGSWKRLLRALLIRRGARRP
ncbi:MAG: glycosyltransferase family 2 protein [Actinomycetia bacterium]|nr:glycosyltransferase family 2 protein [Actinomycetes bacterium]